MQFKDSKFFEELAHKEFNFSFGNFYLCDKFIISELSEGVHFDWDKVAEVVKIIIEHYGENTQIAYLSNRINSYSIKPQSWIDFFKNYDFVVASAIVTYSSFNYLNATIEKHFFEKSLKRCYSLEEAITWIYNLREFN